MGIGPAPILVRCHHWPTWSPPRHHESMHAPVAHVGALADVDVAEGGVAVVAGAAEHHEFAADFPRKQHAIAVERQERVLEPIEPLEVFGRCDADRRSAVSAAPGDVVGLLDFYDAGIVGVVAGFVRVAAGELNRLRLDVPIEPVVAPAEVEMWKPVLLLEAEDADETVAVGCDGAIVNSLHAGDVMAADDRVAGVPPHDGARTGWALLPGDLGGGCRAVGPIALRRGLQTFRDSRSFGTVEVRDGGTIEPGFS